LLSGICVSNLDPDYIFLTSIDSSNIVTVYNGKKIVNTKIKNANGKLICATLEIDYEMNKSNLLLGLTNNNEIAYSKSIVKSEKIDVNIASSRSTVYYDNICIIPRKIELTNLFSVYRDDLMQE